MRLERLQLWDYRNWVQLDLTLSSGITVFLGRNGQGKTNLVEAVCYPSTLGSHRVADTGALIRAGASQAIIRMEAAHEQRRLSIDIELNRQGANRAQLGGRAAKLRELPAAVSAVLFAPEDLALVRGGPAGRRAFLDQALVQRTPRLASTIADYERVLRQRNTLLRTARGVRSPDLSTLELWDDKLIELGATIVAARWQFLVDLRPHLQQAYHQIASSDHPVEVGMSSTVYGSSADEDDVEAATIPTDLARQLTDEVPTVHTVIERFRAVLQERRPKELDRGVSLVGPHRDDVVWWLRELPVRGYASHGESWSYALALKLAVAALVRNDSRTGDPIVVLDDVFAELDSGRRERLAAAIADFEQVLITAAVAEDLPELPTATIIRIAAGEVIE